MIVTTAPAPETSPRARARAAPQKLAIGWPQAVLLAGVAAVCGPTLIENARQSWSTEQGEHGPIVLAIGLWLVVRRWPDMRAVARPGVRTIAALLLLSAAFVYVFGRVADQFLIESYGLYAIGLATLYTLLGAQSLKRAWFPLLYLLFALPLPYTVTWLLTSHLRLWITEAAVAMLQVFGLSIVRDGLTIMIDQYVLAVQEACSGMNSLISLSAIGFVYVYIRRGPRPWYFLVMAAPIVGLAIVANFVRVIILVLLTHFFGDAVAQSYLHESAGVLTFVVALLGVIVVDALLARLVERVRSEPSK